MKPVQLTLSAFGPYATKEIIDFKKLKERSVFLITGDTGSGKTIIFDAIIYALYGVASGESRDISFLRSHFAKPEEQTYVEFIFTIGGLKYKVYRSPDQVTKRQRSLGVKNIQTLASLTMPNGDILNTATLVTEKITELLGLDKEQFRQIIMLPQGEFKKFILAPSKDREKIFRKIFNTEYFKIMQENLKEEVKLLKGIKENLVKEIEINLATIDYKDISVEGANFKNIISEIEEKKNLYQKDKKEIELEIKKITKDIQNIDREIIKSENNNKNLLEKKKKEAKYMELSKRDTFDKFDEILALEKDFETIKDLEIKVISLENAINANLEKNNLLLIELESLGESYNKETIREKSISKTLEEIEILKEELLNLNRSRDKFLEKEECLNNLISMDEKISKNKKDILEIEEKISKCNELKNQILINVSKKEADFKEKEKLTLEKGELLKKIALLEEFKKTHNEVCSLRIELNTLKKELDSLNIAYKKLNSECNNLEDRYREEKALILAKDLKEGCPCPVCGSKIHPKKPNLENLNEYISEEELKGKFERLRRKKEKLDSITIEIDKISNKITLLEGEELKYGRDILNRDIKVINISNAKKISLIFDKLLDEKTIILEKISKLEANAVVEEETYSIAKLNKELVNLNKNLEENQEINGEIYSLIKKIEGKIEILNLDIPKDIIDLKELTRLIYKKEAEISLKENLTKENLGRKEILLEKINVKEEILEKLEKYIEENSIVLKKEKKKLLSLIKKSPFKEKENYVEFKNKNYNFREIEKKVDSFKNEKKILEKEILLLAKKSSALDFVDINKLNLELNNKKLILDELLEKRDVIGVYKDLTLKAFSKISSKYRELEEVIFKYKQILDISDLANGNKKPNISFERYILSSYLDLITAASSKIFSKMTNDRYLLKRMESTSKGRGQKGLELEVYDRYTSTLRNASSLSGGECFKASLAFALGLSEVVQKISGGIKIETMFIDEGFGNLDLESLEVAIDCILSLEKCGRLVGIISHREELKNRIKTRLEVSNSRYGSTTNFNIE